MKSAVSSYSFQKLINNGSENQISIIKKAKELGFEAIEFTELTPHDNSTKIDYAAMIKAECEKHGIAVACYSVGADMLGKDINSEVERIKGEVDIAAALGAPVMRHDTAFTFPQSTRKYRGFTNILPLFADACRKITEYAETRNVRTCVENHGQFCQDSDRMELLVNTVAHENFGLLVDVGNFVCVDEDPQKAVGKCAPYAFHVHLKDFVRKEDIGFTYDDGFFRSRGGAFIMGTVIGHGVVPLISCVRALKCAGYDGYLTLEFEGAEDTEYALSAGAQVIKRLTQLD